MIVSLIILALCIGAMVILTLSEKKTKKTNQNTSQVVSAQDFINVRDIVNHVLYTRDDYCISYIRIQPPMSSLWSRKEKRMKTNTLVAEVSKDREPWTLTAVSRPMDISQLINQYKQIRDETDNPIRKRILKQEMNELQNKVGAGEAIERQFYIKIWTKNKEGAEVELFERARQIESSYQSIGVVTHLLKKADIIRYCNLVHNPAYTNVEDSNVEPSFVMLTNVEDDE